MKKRVFLVRHAKPDTNIKNDDRPLTKEGIAASKTVADILIGQDIDAIYCSPYLRSRQTLLEYSKRSGLDINIVDDFRERLVSRSKAWLTKEEFDEYFMRQWQDMNYKFDDGESIIEVQKRNINALNLCMARHNNIVIGTHGQAMSSIINYYDSNFVFDDLSKLSMPDIYVMKFDDGKFINYKRIYK